jgi:hypothetical protein
MAEGPDEPDTRARARELVASMSPEDMHAFLAAIQGGGLLEPPQRGPEQVDLPEALDPPPLLRVRVDLDGSKPAIWRRLELHGDLTVGGLHGILQAAMGWTDSHLHRFWLGPAKRLWTGPYLLTDWDVEEGEEGTHEDAVELSQVLRAPGDRLFYSYDFGDGWDHTIKVEAVLACPDDAPPARCTGGRNACPPEDVGGVHTHNDLVAAHREAPDRSTMDEQYVDWLPPDWDPLAFDPEDANLAIALVDADLDEILARLRGVPALHPAVASLLGRLPTSVATEQLSALQALTQGHRALADRDPLLDADRVAAAVQPWRLMLQIAGTDGIPLTTAGWMKPAVVERIFAELGLERDWIGKGNREDLTAPVHELRTSAQRVGLLRKHQGRLVCTPAGRALTDDPIGLWLHLAAKAVPGDTTFGDDATVLTLLRLAQGAPATFDVGEYVVDDLRLAGWALQPGFTGQMQALDVCRPLLHLVRRLSGASRRRESGDLEVSRAFALRALVPPAG